MMGYALCADHLQSIAAQRELNFLHSSGAQHLDDAGVADGDLALGGRDERVVHHTHSFIPRDLDVHGDALNARAASCVERVHLEGRFDVATIALSDERVEHRLQESVCRAARAERFALVAAHRVVRVDRAVAFAVQTH